MQVLCVLQPDFCVFLNNVGVFNLFVFCVSTLSWHYPKILLCVQMSVHNRSQVPLSEIMLDVLGSDTIVIIIILTIFQDCL